MLLLAAIVVMPMMVMAVFAMVVLMAMMSLTMMDVFRRGGIDRCWRGGTCGGSGLCWCGIGQLTALDANSFCQGCTVVRCCRRLEQVIRRMDARCFKFLRVASVKSLDLPNLISHCPFSLRHRAPLNRLTSLLKGARLQNAG